MPAVFVTKSFSERDPMTGQDGNKINYNALEFKDRPASTDEEIQLIKDVGTWLKEKGGEMLPAALRSHIPGSNLVELPLGTDHAEIKRNFLAANPAGESASISGASDAPRLASAAVEKSEPPEIPTKSNKKAVELTAEQAEKLGIDF